MSHNPATLYKLNINEKKQNKTSTDIAADPALTFYQENFADILTWSNQLSDELVVQAMKKALKRGITNWEYVISILQSWKDKGIKTLEDVWLEEVEFKQNKKRRKQSYFDDRLKKIEKIVPGWFEERKRDDARKEELKRQKREKELEQLSDPKYAEELKEELEGLLKRFGTQENAENIS